MENDVLYNRIMNVVHEEYGEGSTAVANPEGEATDDLDKIQIGDDVYSISSGGGGTGGTMLVTQSLVDEYTVVLDKTYAEIKTAVDSGIFPYILTTANGITEIAYFAYYGFNDQTEKYGVSFSSDPYYADTEDGVLTQHI